MKNSIETPVQLGRKVNPNSARQIRLAEIQAKREAGLIKRGRPVNPESARAKRIADLEARRANGTLKLGRPKAVVVDVPVKAKAKVKSKVVAE